MTFSIKTLSQLFRKADWRLTPRADILAVRHDADCGQMINGKYYSPLIDSILDEINGCSILTVASPYSYRSKTACYSGALNFNGAFAREALLRRLMGFIGLKKNASHLDTWRRIIHTVRPRCVIGIQPPAALCRACHEQGVIVFDTQHGYIGPNNPSYGEKFQIAREREDLADCILCWDEDSASAIRGWTSQKNIQLRVIGNPWVNKFLLHRKDDRVIQFFEKSGQLIQKRNVRPRILVSLQWGLNDSSLTPNQELFNNEFMPIGLENAIKKTQEKYDWILRPHPVQCTNKPLLNKLVSHVKVNLGSDIEISENNPLPFLLAGVDLHITYNSSVVIEAGYFGVRSAVLDPQVIDGIYAGYYSSQIDTGLADIVACNDDAIQKWLEESLVNACKKGPTLTVLQGYSDFLKQLRTLGSPSATHA